MPRRSVNPNASNQRSTLRAIGVACVGVGGVLAAIGLISFFSAFGGGGNPSYFWCVFLGAPLVMIGMKLLAFGYMGAVQRYVAGEVAPVATDTVNYVARGSRSAVRDVASAFREGLDDDREELSIRERLERLDGLLRDGLIDAKDHEEQKKRILEDL